MTKGLFILGAGNYERIYSPTDQQAIRQLVDIYAPPMTADEVVENRAILRDAEVIFSGWGGPRMDADFMNAAPNLKAVFYGAGSIRYMVSDAFWARDVQITSAASANAVSVAEYTLSQVLFSLKSGWQHVLEIKRTGQWKKQPVAGVYGSTVGLISLGMVGRRVAELLRQFDLHIIAYDPFVSAQTAAIFGVEMVELDDIFSRSDVVSLHAPWLPETVGMITGAHFAMMKPNAAFINTARGAVVREAEMIDVLRQRPDIYALLDVTYPEPPEPESPLYTLPNVLLTPHIAGAMGTECWRMGRYMVEELQRYLKGEPLRYGVTQAQIARMA